MARKNTWLLPPLRPQEPPTELECAHQDGGSLWNFRHGLATFISASSSFVTLVACILSSLISHFRCRSFSLLARCLSRCPFYSFLLALFQSPSLLRRAAQRHIEGLLEVVSCAAACLRAVASLRVHAALHRALAALSAPRAILLQGPSWPGGSHKPCETPLGLVLVVPP